MPQLSKSTQTSLSEINMVPFVDVVLVLLIIFMITAPILQSGIEVDVPKTRTVKEINQERLVVVVTAWRQRPKPRQPTAAHNRLGSRDPDVQVAVIPREKVGVEDGKGGAQQSEAKSHGGRDRRSEQRRSPDAGARPS